MLFIDNLQPVCLYCIDLEDCKRRANWQCTCCEGANTLWQNYGLTKYSRLLFKLVILYISRLMLSISNMASLAEKRFSTLTEKVFEKCFFFSFAKKSLKMSLFLSTFCHNFIHICSQKYVWGCC